MKTSLVPPLCLLIALTTAATLGPVSAQEVYDSVGSPVSLPTQFTFHLGLGPGSNGLGGQMGIALHHAAGEFMLRTAGTSDFQLFGGSTSYGDLAFLYGRRAKTARGWLGVAAGPSWASRDADAECLEPGFLFCSRYAREKSGGLGLALALDAVWTPFGSLGFGIGGFADLNGAGSFAGVTLSLHVGQVR